MLLGVIFNSMPVTAAVVGVVGAVVFIGRTLLRAVDAEEHDTEEGMGLDHHGGWLP